MHIDSLKHHISHLEHSHEKLERDLLLLERQHGNDTFEAHNIKKKKLFLKDEIERCRHKLTEML
jgi:hypothetical protein